MSRREHSLKTEYCSVGNIRIQGWINSISIFVRAEYLFLQHAEDDDSKMPRKRTAAFIPQSKRLAGFR